MKAIACVLALSLAFASCSRSPVPEMKDIAAGRVAPSGVSGMPTHPEPLDADGMLVVKEFSIGQREVTVGEFRRFVEASGYKTFAELSGGAWTLTARGWMQGPDNSWKKTYFPQTEDSAVTCISFIDAVNYCNWLSLEAGLEPAYRIVSSEKSFSCETIAGSKGYRLPTEAEWTLARYGKGAETAMLADPALVAEGAGVNPAVEAPPSPYGLAGMATDVWEWCENVVTENTAPSERRALRGGLYLDFTELRHYTSYFHLSQLGRDFYYGIRIAKSK